MKRFWTSWYSGNYEDEGCTNPPFQFWVTGYSGRNNYGLTAAQQAELAQIEDEDSQDDYLEKHARTNCTICAAINGEDEEAVWKLVNTHFPDYVERFIDEVPLDFVPGDRFK